MIKWWHEICHEIFIWLSYDLNIHYDVEMHKCLCEWLKAKIVWNDKWKVYGKWNVDECLEDMEMKEMMNIVRKLSYEYKWQGKRINDIWLNVWWLKLDLSSKVGLSRESRAVSRHRVCIIIWCTDNVYTGKPGSWWWKSHDVMIYEIAKFEMQLKLLLTWDL